MKRDLMTDLKSIQEGRTLFDDPDPSVETKYELYEVAEHAIGRAIKAERLKDMLVKYSKFLVAEVLNKQERSEQLEALARELAETLEVAQGEMYARYQVGISDRITGLVLGVLQKAKKVLGDE